MKILFSLIISFVALITYGQSINFGGTYKINKDKTLFGQAPEHVLPVTFMAAQSTDNLTIIRVSTTGNETKEDLKFDGSVFESKVSDSDVKSTFKWVDDGKAFVVTREYTNVAPNMNRTITEKWELDNTGKTLKISREVNPVIGQGYSITGYYEKVEVAIPNGNGLKIRS